MKINLDKIFASVATATMLALPIVSVASLSANAIEVPQRVINGLYRTSAEDFFQAGQRQFEREIQIFQDRRLASEEPILNVSDEMQVQERLSPLEIRNLSPREDNRRNLHKPRHRRY